METTLSSTPDFCRRHFRDFYIVRAMVEIPWPWYKCQNSQNAQKCIRRVLKVIWGLPAESPKRVSRTVQTLFRTGGNCLKRGFAPCKRLFWESRPGGPKTPFAPSLSTFGHLGCFDSCTRAAESFGVSTWPTGCDTPSPFSGRFPPWRACEVEVREPPPPPSPPKKGASQRYLRDTT